MLIRMLVDLSGPGLLLGPGDERDFPKEEALRLIAAEYAVPVAEREIERSVINPISETRDEPERRHGKRKFGKREH